MLCGCATERTEQERLVEKGVWGTFSKRKVMMLEEEPRKGQKGRIFKEHPRQRTQQLQSLRAMFSVLGRTGKPLL